MTVCDEVDEFILLVYGGDVTFLEFRHEFEDEDVDCVFDHTWRAWMHRHKVADDLSVDTGVDPCHDRQALLLVSKVWVVEKGRGG